MTPKLTSPDLCATAHGRTHRRWFDMLNPLRGQGSPRRGNQSNGSTQVFDSIGAIEAFEESYGVSSAWRSFS
jgi:hypothetical protein